MKTSNSIEWHQLIAENGKVIANINVEEGNHEDSANAHLITLAPELLHACHDVCRWIFGSGLYDESNQTLISLREIVAKSRKELR